MPDEPRGRRASALHERIVFKRPHTFVDRHNWV